MDTGRVWEKEPVRVTPITDRMKRRGVVGEQYDRLKGNVVHSASIGKATANESRKKGRKEDRGHPKKLLSISLSRLNGPMVIRHAWRRRLRLSSSVTR